MTIIKTICMLNPGLKPDWNWSRLTPSGFSATEVHHLLHNLTQMKRWRKIDSCPVHLNSAMVSSGAAYHCLFPKGGNTPTLKNAFIIVLIPHTSLVAFTYYKGQSTICKGLICCFREPCWLTQKSQYQTCQLTLQDKIWPISQDLPS